MRAELELQRARVDFETRASQLARQAADARRDKESEQLAHRR